MMTLYELTAKQYVPVQLPVTKLRGPQAPGAVAYIELVGALLVAGMEDSEHVRKMVTDTYGIEYRIHENQAFVPRSVMQVWEWCGDKPWPRDGKPYRNWACAKAGQGVPEDFAAVLDTIHRMVGMAGALAFIERGIDLRNSLEPDAIPADI